MNLRQCASTWLNRAADIVENFPANLARALRARRDCLVGGIRRAAHGMCGCSHRTAVGCALYRKNGPERCPCACHPKDASRVASYTYRVTATGADEVKKALEGVSAAAERLRQTPLHLHVERSN